MFRNVRSIRFAVPSGKLSRRAKVALAALVSLAAIQAAPAQAAESSFACSYQADFHSADGKLFVGKYAGSFTEFTCARARHDGTVETLSLVPGSGAASGMISQLVGPSVYMTFGGNSQADIELTNGAGGGESFRLYPAIQLYGGLGTITGNLKGEGGFGSFGMWGSATLTNCQDDLNGEKLSGPCKEDWHIVGALTIPDWVER